ncbi:C-X-C motif chemokine 19 [Lampris incognitus]|uniref:C-X-C motif chemokine 19 n=1 Tax=Lampris incognitus TaxID=2546036 RepID=UPI0024B5002B|nr:C-X-C motif chemokine 19 [Lampris incognitus]
MKLSVLLLLFISAVFTTGMPPVSRDYNTHCRCPQVETRVIPPDSLKSIKIIPKGVHCQVTEVIAGLVGGERICLDGQAPWVRKLIHYVFGKMSTRKGALLPNKRGSRGGTVHVKPAL